MARIRTIKPDFWTDEALSECSVSARLLFIGTWNFADDNGNLERSPKKLKMQIFPADNIDCEPLVNELIAQGVLTEYSVNGKNYLHIKGFDKHQVINRKSKFGYHPTPLTADAVNTHGVDNAEGKCSGKDLKDSSDKSLLVETEGSDLNGHAVDRVPYSEIVKLYHEILPMCPQVQKLTEARRAQIRARWRTSDELPSLERWREYFERVRGSPFLTGKVDPPPGRKRFVANLEWLSKSSSLVKVAEGNYDDG